MQTAAEPWSLFADWLAEAGQTEPRVPEAMQIATADGVGLPSLRTVLLKAHGPDGLVFYTNLSSRKGQQLAASPHCAFLLHYKGLERQVMGEGPVSPVSDAVADAYFATRARGSQLGAWASRQSQPLTSRKDLQDAYAAIASRFEGQPVPRPPFWSGFCIQPSRIEFWQGMPDRLHQRLEFTPTSEGWQKRWLQP